MPQTVHCAFSKCLTYIAEVSAILLQDSGGKERRQLVINRVTAFYVCPGVSELTY